MGKRGPAKKPTKLAELQGNPGRRPLPKKEVASETSKPTCPAWLTPYAKTEWRYIVPKLELLGLINKIDRATLAAYCESVSDFRTATEHMQREGVKRVYQTHNGNWLSNPWLIEKRKAAAAMVRYAALFGMSPSHRAGWEAPEDQPTLADELFKLMNGGG